ncbi:MAG: hypothetical protein AAF547_22030 [Actinomycetota bacterium]
MTPADRGPAATDTNDFIASTRCGESADSIGPTDGGAAGAHRWSSLDDPISLNQFFPFVLADSLAKRSELRSIRRTRGVYTPAVDYWRLLRLQIVAYHQFRPGPGLDALSTAVELAHPDRREHYATAVTNYRRFLGRKRVQWLGTPRRAVWLADELKVRVNPELHVTINEEPHVVKLFLKADPRWALTQRTANPLAYLLHACHGHLGRPLVVDVLRGRAFGLTRQNVDYDALLRAQAAAFTSLWESGAGIPGGGDPGPGAAEESPGGGAVAA